MKKLAFTAIIVASLGFTSMAQAGMSKSMEASLVKVCEALKSDVPIRLHRAMKSARVSYKQVSEGLVCNGKNAIEFAMHHDAQETAGLVARRTNVDINSLLAKR